MRALVVLLMLLVAAAPVQSQTVQKCAWRDGRVRYQSEPCERGSRTVETWEAVPDPVVPVDDAMPRTRSHRRPAHAPRARRRATAGIADGPDACMQARAYRDAAERRAGLDRDYDLLSALQRRVFDACR